MVSFDWEPKKFEFNTDACLTRIHDQQREARQALSEAHDRGDKLCQKVIGAWLKELATYEGIAAKGRIKADD